MGVHCVAHEATTHYTYVHRTVTSTKKANSLLKMSQRILIHAHNTHAHCNCTI